MEYAEKVRSQLLSLRQLQRSPNFSIDEKAENLPISGGFSRTPAILEIAELHLYGLGDSIFLQTFVLHHFGIVQKDQVPEGSLAVRVSWGSNLSRISKTNAARIEIQSA
jgi:hypothetical protein